MGKAGLTQCPSCRYDKYDCFAYKEGKCKALDSTFFKSGRCPFYKSKDKVEYVWRK